MTLVAMMFFVMAFAQEEEPYSRKGAQVPHTSTAPALDGEMDEAVYTGDALAIETWNGNPDTAPIDGVEAQYWFAYDDDYLYVYSEISVPDKQPKDEIGITVSIDVESQNYGWQEVPYGEDGFLFSKIEFSEEADGADPRYAMVEGVERRVRQWDWVFLHSTDGYQVEGRLAWDDITTDDAKVAEFKERGVFYFDIGYKLSDNNNYYVAWSNDDNNSYQQTNKVGVVNFEHVRKEAVVNKTETAPAHNAFRETDIYTGDGFPIENWTTRDSGGSLPMMPTPVDGASGHFWFAYDENNLYVYGELTAPADLDPVHEVGILVSLDEEDVSPGWQADPYGDDGFVFSKMEFATEAEGADARYAMMEGDPRTIRQFEYVYIKEGNTFEYEVIIPWNNITSNQTIIDDFWERGTFFFDIGYKLESDDALFFAWSNNDNNIWRRTYRAGIVMLGERVNVSEIAGKESSLAVYPNPARDVLYINAESNVRGAEVFNLLGARVLTADVQSGTVDISSLKEGVYIIRVNYENGTGAVSRFVKN